MTTNAAISNTNSRYKQWNGLTFFFLPMTWKYKVSLLIHVTQFLLVISDSTRIHWICFCQLCENYDGSSSSAKSSLVNLQMKYDLVSRTMFHSYVFANDVKLNNSTPTTSMCKWSMVLTEMVTCKLTKRIPQLVKEARRMSTGKLIIWRIESESCKI